MASAKKPNVKPTQRAKKAFDNLAENGGNKYRALLDAGYSEVTAKSPAKVTESRGWKILLEEHLSDEMLTSKHQELLNKQEVIVRNNVSTGEIEVIPTGQLDVQAVKAALDMAYKLKGSYAAEKSIVATVNITDEKKQKSRSAIQRLLGVDGDS